MNVIVSLTSGKTRATTQTVQFHWYLLGSMTAVPDDSDWISQTACLYTVVITPTV